MSRHSKPFIMRKNVSQWKSQLAASHVPWQSKQEKQRCITFIQQFLRAGLGRANPTASAHSSFGTLVWEEAKDSSRGLSPQSYRRQLLRRETKVQTSQGDRIKGGRDLQTSRKIGRYSSLREERLSYMNMYKKVWQTMQPVPPVFNRIGTTQEKVIFITQTERLLWSITQQWSLKGNRLCHAEIWL